MTRGEEPTTSEAALAALFSVLGEHQLVDEVVTRYATWEELARSDAAERARRVGPWAAALRVPPRCPPLPDLGPGVGVLTRYSRAYPARLTELPDAPVLVYHRDRVLDGPLVGVGGSSWPSPHGTEVARAAARVSVENRWAVVAALDTGCGQAALEEAVERGGRVVAVASCDLSAPSSHSELVGRVLAQHGCVVSEWGPGEAFSESRTFAAQRLVAALARAVVVAELGTHPAGGAHLARAAVATSRPLVVPEPPVGDAAAERTGLVVLGRPGAFSARVFGASPAMLGRVGRGLAAADEVVRGEEEMASALARVMRSAR